jgi:O-antigen/teichoic acid export membrane protein
LKYKYLEIKSIYGRIKNLGSHLQNLSLFLLATIISSSINALINPFLAANLSPKDYAIIGYFLSFNTLISVIISFSLLSYYSRSYFKIREDERQLVLNTLLISQLLFGFIMLFFVFVGFYFYMNIAKVHFLFLPFAILCFIPVFFKCFYNFLLVEKRMKRQAMSYFKISILNTIFVALFAILFVVILKKGAIGRFWGILIPMTGMGVFSFIKLISKYQFSWKVVREAVVFSWPISISAILYYFISDIDRAMLEKLHDTTTFGFYNVAIQITSYLYIFYAAISQTFEPDIYQAIAENKRKKLLKIVAGIIVLNAVPVLLFILFAYPIINILTYGRYVESIDFVRILAIKTIPMSFCFLISTVIIGFGYPKVELVNRVIGALISIIIYRFLIGKYGFYGAAWGQSIALAMMASISAIFIIYKLISTKKKHGQKDLLYS